MPADWKADFTLPLYRDFQPLLQSWPTGRWPGLAVLNACLTEQHRTRSGATIRFCRQHGRCSAAQYESGIYQTGHVPTRNENWHDLFNACVWLTFPETKAAINAGHVRHLQVPNDHRGRVRDALTLFDECGAAVLSDDQALLRAIARQDWPAAFIQQRAAWPGAKVVLIGHALLEKAVRPYKAITAQTLLVHGRADTSKAATAAIDRTLGSLITERLAQSAETRLTPLPLMGVPGWWIGEQNAAFYDDPGVFRQRRENRLPADILPLQP